MKRRPLASCPPFCTVDRDDTFHSGESIPEEGQLVHYGEEVGFDIPNPAGLNADSNAVHLTVRLAAAVEAEGHPGPTVLDCQGGKDDWFPLSNLATLDLLSTRLSMALTTVLRARTHIVREQAGIRPFVRRFEAAEDLLGADN